MKSARELAYLQAISSAKAAVTSRAFAVAIGTCSALLERYPRDPVLLRLLGIAYRESGDINESLKAFQSVCVENPLDDALWSDLAITLIRSGDPSEALKVLLKASTISPGAADTHANLTAVFDNVGDSIGAERSGKRALLLAPSHVGALVNLGDSAGRRGQPDRALVFLGRAVVLDPARAEAWYGIARFSYELDQTQSALVAISHTIELRWRIFEPALTCSAILIKLRRFRESIESAYRALAIGPACEPAISNIAMGLANSGSPEAGVIAGQRAIRVNPRSSMAHLNLGTALRECMRLQESLQAFADCRDVGGDSADLRFTESHCQLLMGDFEQGWRNYEARWDSKTNRAKMDPIKWKKAYPVFSGATRRRVLVWAEQGIGDEIMFGGLLPEFERYCGTMLLQVDQRLVGLFGRALPNIKKVFSSEERVPPDEYDEQIPLGSLGEWLRPSRESFFRKGGRYLSAIPGLAGQLRSEFGVGHEEILVGLSWRSAAADTGTRRSLDLSLLMAALKGIGHTRFVNLQYGNVNHEITEVQRTQRVELLSHREIDNKQNLEGLAGLIEACDLVISIGNATAHLAGALGQRTWVLLPQAAGWRWLHEGFTCPWYESVRLYRQSNRRSWEEVVHQLSKDFIGFSTEPKISASLK